MKKVLIALALAAASTTASANFDFFDNNDGEWKMGPNGPYWDEGSDWPEWTPMYWMEEFMDSWDDDDDYNYNGMMPFNNGNPYGAMPYGQMPMMPAPMPYGGYQQAPVMPAPVAPMPTPVAPAK